MTKLKIGVVTALVAGSIVVPLTLQRHALLQVRQDNQSLRQQLEQMAAVEKENVRLSHQLAQAATQPEAAPSPSAELLRLRGEVGVLRQLLQEARQPAAPRTHEQSSPRPTSPEVPLEYQMRAEGRHWVQTHADITVGSLVQQTHEGYMVRNNVAGRPDLPTDSGTLGLVLSINTDDLGHRTALVDFGGGYTRTNTLSELAVVSDSAAPDSAEGALRAQGKQWAKASGQITAGDFVEDILDGRHDQPNGRGAIGKVISVTADENNSPAAMVDFGRDYIVGISLAELSRVSLAPR